MMFPGKEEGKCPPWKKAPKAMCVAGVMGASRRGCKGNRQVTQIACAQRFCNLTCESYRKEQIYLNSKWTHSWLSPTKWKAEGQMIFCGDHNLPKSQNSSYFSWERLIITAFNTLSPIYVTPYLRFHMHFVSFLHVLILYNIKIRVHVIQKSLFWDWHNSPTI